MYVKNYCNFVFDCSSCCFMDITNMQLKIVFYYIIDEIIRNVYNKQIEIANIATYNSIVFIQMQKQP